jgi:hypothetical protein
MQNEKHILSIPVNAQLVLNAGWWQMYEEDNGSRSRLIYPPEPTLFEQILQYLETTLETSPLPPEKLFSLEEQAQAALAVCIRWGSYFAVLADQTKPLWSLAKQSYTSCIENAEMTRINIEASAAFEQWVDLMRTDFEHYCALVWAARNLPRPLPPLRVHRKKAQSLECSLFSFGLQYLRSPETRYQMTTSKGSEEQVEQKWQQIQMHPTRFLANGLVNMCWRNASGIENIHAGDYAAVPLLQRRITEQQDQMLAHKACEMVSIALETVQILIQEQGEDAWATRIFPFCFAPMVFSAPDNWSLDEKTRQVKLDEGEP